MESEKHHALSVRGIEPQFSKIGGHHQISNYDQCATIKRQIFKIVGDLKASYQALKF